MDENELKAWHDRWEDRSRTSIDPRWQCYQWRYQENWLDKYDRIQTMAGIPPAGTSCRSFQHINPLLIEVVERIQERHDRDNPSDITGVPTGYHDLDQCTSGLQPGDLLIVAGRPSMGKTSFALNIAEHVACLRNWGRVRKQSCDEGPFGAVSVFPTLPPVKTPCPLPENVCPYLNDVATWLQI
jgi:hypothetical protein